MRTSQGCEIRTAESASGPEVKATARGLPGSWAPVLAAVVASGLLLAAAIFIQRGIQDASNLVARGVGQAIAVAGWEALGGSHFPPDLAALQQFLADHAEDGLRYVAVIDDSGAVTVSAGDALGSGMKEGLTLLPRRARLVGRIGPRRGTQPANAPRPHVVYEFEPVLALELQRRANELLIVAALCSIGLVALALALARSLRHRERLGEELEQGRRLAALGTMSAVLAHELRNPLTSLKGHAQLLAETVESDAGLSPKVARIVSEASRLERLTNDLLAFVKSGELHRAPVDAVQLLREAIRATAEDRIDARVPEAPVIASLDAERLRQALENVLRNAVQASPPEGRVTAEVSRVNGELFFSVRDRGGGITPGEEERIFEPFVTGKTRGIGLGLAITRRVVELHGGTITARNADGGGAEFTLRIPAKEA